MMKKSLLDPKQSEIMIVPDNQMNNFIRVASAQDDKVFFLNYEELNDKTNKRVRIIDGYFAGVEGIIKRINRNKRVVVQIEGVAAVAIAFVPTSCLQLL